MKKITATSVFESKLIDACKYYRNKIIPGQNVEDRARKLTKYFYIAVPVYLYCVYAMVALVGKLSTHFLTRILPCHEPIFPCVISSPECDKNVFIFS